MSKMEKKNVLYRNEQAERLTWPALETELRRWMGKKPISAGVKTIFEDVKKQAVTGRYGVELKIGTIGNDLYLRCKKAKSGSIGGHLQDVKLATSWTRPPEEEEDEDFRERCRQAVAAREEAREAGEDALRQVTKLDDDADRALAALAELRRLANERVKQGQEVREALLVDRYLEVLAKSKQDAGPIERRFFRIFETHRSDREWNTFNVKSQDIPGYGQSFATTVLKNLYAQVSAKVEEIDVEHAQGVEMADDIRQLANDSGQARALALRQLQSVRNTVQQAAVVMRTVGGAEFDQGHTDVGRKLSDFLGRLEEQDDAQQRIARLDMLLNLYEKAVGVTKVTAVIGRRLVTAARQVDDIEKTAQDKTLKEGVKAARREIQEVALEVKAWTVAVAKGQSYVTKAKAAVK